MDARQLNEAATRLLERPIFIAGRGRSGTSLLQRLFDSHPQVATLNGEGRLFTELAPNLRKTGDRAAAVTAITVRFPLRNGQTDPLLRERVDALDIDSPFLERDILAIGVERWLRRHAPRVPAVYLEKTPKNEEYLPSLFANFPRARVVYVVRDPRGVYISNRRSDLHRMTPEFVAAQWVKSVRRIMTAMMKQGLSPPIHVMRFEELVAEPRATLERLCDVLELDWSETLTAPTALGKPWHGNAYDEQKRTPDGVAPHKADEWRGEITPEEEAAIIAVARPEMSLLGYTNHSAIGSRASISS
jgi:hypothetical protein